jgi:glyceraldehyde-3-phosphate dehydrogenase (NADP+)
MQSRESLLDAFPDPGGIPADARLDAPVRMDGVLVGGKVVPWEGPFQDVTSPVRIRSGGGALSPAVIGRFPLMTEEAALRSLDAAVKAWDRGRGEWPTMPVAQRIRCFEKFLDRMRAARAEVVRLLMWEIGKSRPDSEKEFDRTVIYVRDTLNALKDLDRASSRFTIEDGVIGQIRRAPLGVTLCMGPFNYPLNETYTTLVPAILMGNPVVFKPPRFGVLLHAPLLSAFGDCFPPGVVNLVSGVGRQVVGPLMASGKIDVFAFIGTSPAADAIRKQHPKPHRLRCVLGLEAKNPAVILPDADLELAVKECLLGTLSFNGQRCTAIKLVFVHESVAADFVERLSAAVSALKIGMPWNEGVSITPLPEPGKPALLAELVADAVAKGARVVNPGGGATAESFFSPAVVYPVSASMRLFREEQFGPVVPVVPFRNPEEAVAAIVASDYGQQVALFGKDPEQLARLVDPLVNQVSRVNLNSQCQRGPDTFPFTGRKDSAEGTLSVTDALRVFSIRALVAAKETDLNRGILTDILRERRSSFLSTDYIF